MKDYMYERLRPHIGHNLVCVYYGDKDDPADICIECEDCCEVLISAETFEFEEDNDIGFKIGDWVYADDWCYGQIVDMHSSWAIVEFETYGGGGSYSFKVTELKHAPAPR